MIKSYKNLEVYNESFDLAMEIFQLTRKFPKEEVYSTYFSNGKGKQICAGKYF